MFLVLLCILIPISPFSSLIAQEVYLAEGFALAGVVPAQAARTELERMKAQNPAVTVDQARLVIAQRTARMEAIRNLAEYLHGIRFEYRDGEFRQLRVTTSGTVQPGNCTYRELPSGIVIAEMELSPSAETRQARQDLEVRTVTGTCTDERVDNVLMAMRQARLDAYANAVREALGTRAADRSRSGSAVTGTLYIVRTVEDSTDHPYTVKLMVQVAIER